MRIAEETPDRLVVEERPWLLAAILVLFLAFMLWSLVENREEFTWLSALMAAPWLVALPLVLHFSVLWVTARFDRATGRIEIARRGFGTRSQEVYQLAHLICARVDETQGESGPTRRLVLVFDKEMLAEMEPARLSRLDGAWRKRLRQTAPSDVPLTAYFASGSGPLKAAKAINAWAPARAVAQEGVLPAEAPPDRPRFRPGEKLLKSLLSSRLGPSGRK